MSARDNFIALLEAGDLNGLIEHWAYCMPNAPQPGEGAEIVMHLTRTQTWKVSFKARAYSHRWLTERGYPSRLPDELRPKAERMYPEKAFAVGVASMSQSESSLIIRKTVTDAIEDINADGKLLNHDLVKARMEEVRQKEKQLLFGRWGK